MRPPGRRGFYSSFIAMCSPLAQLLANGMLFGIAALLKTERFAGFGWRIPFLLSFLLVRLGMYIRMRVSETPKFEADRKVHRASCREQGVAVDLHVPTILRLIAVWAAVSVGYFIATVFMLSYMMSKLGISKETSFAILIAAHIVSMFTMGLGGALSDPPGRRATMLVGSRTMLIAFIALIALIAFLPLVMSGQTLLIGAAILFLLGAVQFHAGVQPAYFAEAFPTETRYRGSAVAYNIANLVGSSAPFAATLIQAKAGGANWPIVCTGIAVNLLSMWAIYAGPRHAKPKTS